MTFKTVLLGGALLVTGLVAGLSISAFGPEESIEESPPEGPQILYWQAPMDPNFRRDEPGKSPMGMDLIPVYADDGAEEGDFVLINPAVQNNIGVRTAAVTRSDFNHVVSSVGYVRPDENRTYVVDVRAEGWVEELPVAAVGDVVENGDLLFRMYAPDIATAQAEFVQATRLGRESLIAASRSRLLSLGMTARQISGIARSNNGNRLVDVRAPQGGIVIDMNVREGAFVRPGDHLMTISDLDDVWVLVDVFEDDAAMVEAGQPVSFTVSSLPARRWQAEVDYVYPVVDPQSRTVTVRVRVPNEDGALRPQMYVSAEISTEPHSQVLTIPREAVIRTGQSDRVIIALGEGRFQPVRVVTGMESRGRIEIVSGLDEGEMIVISSQFLIDSEASLQGTMLRMTAPQGGQP